MGAPNSSVRTGPVMNVLNQSPDFHGRRNFMGVPDFRLRLLMTAGVPNRLHPRLIMGILILAQYSMGVPELPLSPISMGVLKTRRRIRWVSPNSKRHVTSATPRSANARRAGRGGAREPDFK
jgi:hypothetical protein